MGAERLGSGDVLLAAIVVVTVVRVAVAVAELRPRLPGRRVMPDGRFALTLVVALVLHDVLVGLSLLGAVMGGVWRVLAVTSPGPGVRTVTVAVAAGTGFALGSWSLHRQRGVALRSTTRPRRTVAELCPTVRSRLLDAAEREGRRASSRWIDVRLERCRRQTGATHEQLLSALWPAVRLRLREVTGIPRTEMALLLVQAQAVADDVAPPEDRMRTLLHLLHDRAGRRVVAAALEETRRTPIRHVRSGLPAVAAHS
ncbi:MAG: hypothetical protein QG622_159 [Actinomycetota bacterium]|nr:hypothetical protein [Actinomycetota bacterium]